MQNKKAAMFGLDARIALAIFGALSVITGAALYKAIGTAKVTADISEMNEVHKAIEAYMLDTGVDLPLHGGSTKIRNGGKLTSSSQKGWQGSYLGLSYTDSGTSGWFLNSRRSLVIGTYSDLDWITTSEKECSEGGSCYYWINFGLRKDGDQREYMKKIDIAVDGTDSPNTGKFRVRYWTTPDVITRGSLQGPPTLAK